MSTHRVQAALSTIFMVGPFLVCVGHVSWMSRPNVAESPLPAAPVLGTPSSTIMDDAVASPWAGEPRTPLEVVPHEPERPHLEIALSSEYGVVLANDVPVSWAAGPWLPGSDDRTDTGEWVARRRAELGEVPAELAELRGTVVDVYGTHGRVCSAVITRLEVVAASNGYSVADERLADGETVDAARAAVFAEHERWLVGTLQATWGRCEQGVFARSAELPAPTLWTEWLDDAAVREVPVALEESFRHKTSRRLRTEYAAYVAEAEQSNGRIETPATWEEFYESTLRVRVFADDTHAPRAVAFEAGDLGGCQGGFEGLVQDLVDLEGFRSFGEIEDPLMFVGVRKDGAMQPISASGSAFVLWSPDGADEQASTVRPYVGCSC